MTWKARDMGRHCKPKDPKGTTARRAVVVAGVTGALGTGAVMAAAPSAVAAPSAGSTVWDRLAQCESSGNFANRDTGGNGHFGGFQFSPATWRSVGGRGSPADASPAEQLMRAKILLTRSGPGQWECKVGLTRANGAAQGLTILANVNKASARVATSQRSRAVTSTGAARSAVAFANAQLGKPYIFGAEGPNSFDCSGLTQAAWKAAGVSIPRTSQSQLAGLQRVPASSVRPGDLVIYKDAGHVAIYIGDGKIIEAPRPGGQVRTAPFRSGWYAENFVAVVRPAGGGVAGVRVRVAPVPRAVAVPPSVAKRGVHKVVRGDTLSAIAVQHNVAEGWYALFVFNRGVVGASPHTIYPGQSIKLL